MIKYLSLIFFFYSFVSSAQIDFPDNLSTERSAKHQRVWNSNLYIDFPADYVHPPHEAWRYVKNDSASIEASDNDQSFYAFKNNLRPEIERMSKSGTSVTWKPIIVNGLDGFFVEIRNPKEKPGVTEILMVFGDSSYKAHIYGFFKTSDQAAKKEILAVFKSVYYETLFPSSTAELMDIAVDLSITGYKQAGALKNTLIYSENGENGFFTKNTFSISKKSLFTEYVNEAKNIRKEASIEAATHYTEELLKRLDNAFITVENPEIKETKVGNYRAFVIESKIKVRPNEVMFPSDIGKEGIVYLVVFLGKRSSLAFLGVVFEKKEEFLEKYKKTVLTIVDKNAWKSNE